MDVTPSRPESRDPGLDPRLHAERDARGDDAMVLRAEELRVRMVPEVTGRVTLRKRLVTEERTVVVTVQREELEVVEEGAESVAGASEPGVASGAAATPAVAGEASPTGAERVQAEYLQAAALSGLTPDAMPVPAFDATTGRSAAGLDDTEAGELVLFEQRPVVTLEWVPVERVRVQRTTVVEEQTFTGEVRREEAEVLHDGPEPR